MIEPTDRASDEGWDDDDEDPSAQTANSASDDRAARGDDPATGDDDQADDQPETGSDDGADLERRDDDEGRDDDGGTRRRRRKKRPEAAPVADERAQQALDFVAKVVLEMEMDCRVRLRRPRNSDDVDEVSIEIIGKDAGRIIGKKGAVLQAIQFLTHRVINRPGLDRRHVLVDAEGYRSRRDNSLATMARRLGKQAVDQGKIITFEPMNPRDRRVVHLALAKFEGVITKSDGEGDDRRVQIIPVRR